MATDWRPMPNDRLTKIKPFDGEYVLLGIPRFIAGGGLDPQAPYSLHLGYWVAVRQMFATNEVDDSCGRSLWLHASATALWAEVDPPNWP